MTRTKAQATAGVWPNTGTGAGQAGELIMSGVTRKAKAKTSGSGRGRGRDEDGGELTSFAEARARAARQQQKPVISRGGGRGADVNGSAVLADAHAEAVDDDEHNAYDDDSDDDSGDDDDDDDESTWSAVAGPLAGFTAPRSTSAVDEEDDANAADAEELATRQRGDGRRTSGGNGCLIA